MEFVKRVFDNVAGDLDLIFVYNAANETRDNTFFYFTGYDRGVFEGSGAFAFPDGKVSAFVPGLEGDTARNSGGPDVVEYVDNKSYSAGFKSLLKGVTKIGINKSNLTVRVLESLKKFAPKAKFVDVGDAIAKAREIKSSDEIDKITEACKIASSAYAEVLELDLESMTETALAAELAYIMGRKGAQGLSFDTIVAMGETSGEPHYSPSSVRKAKPNDIVLIDYGCKVRRYCSDISRTFFFGKPEEKKFRMYETVLEAQTTALDMIAPGVNAGDVGKAVRKFIDKSEFKGRFIHGLGHSIGLDIHDGQSFGVNSDYEFEPGMVLTVEPGIYLNGYGGVRIEDNILITKTGYKLLTPASKELVIV